MFVLRVLSYLFGYVTMVVRGKTLERFINMATTRGIRFWDIKRTGPDEIRVRTRLAGVKPLRHIARRTGSRFHVAGRSGLPFFLWRLRRRKMMALGGLFFLVALYFFSSFVWSVEVEGTKLIKPREVLEAARGGGLYAGVPKWRFDVPDVERKIRDDLERVSWVGIEIKGTRAKISVAEKKLPAADDDAPSNILAGKAGLVKEVLVLSGQAVVREGDTVLPGQLLISGEVWPQSLLEQPAEESADGENGSLRDVQPRYVRARGIVRARVWYEGYGEAPLREERRELTGRKESRTAVRVLGREWVVTGPRKPPFKDFETETASGKRLEWRSFAAPVEIVTTTYREVKTVRERHSRAEALRVAEQRAADALKERLPGDAKVLNRRVEVIRTGTAEDLVRVKVVTETLEDIGKEKDME